MRITILLLLFSYGALKSQNSFSPVDVTSAFDLLDSGEPIKTIRSVEMAVVLKLTAGEWALEYACTDGDRLNILLRANSKLNKSTLLLVIANKFNGKWIGVDSKILHLPNMSITKKKKLIEFNFPDISTLYFGYEFKNGEKKTYLVRIVIDGIEWYEPSHDPHSDKVKFEKKLLSPIRGDLFRQLRPNY